MLSELFDFVLNNYIKAKTEQSFAGHPLGECVRSTIPGILRSEHCANNEYVIKGSVGQGAWATVPWIAIMNKGITTTTQNGVYLVYLFSADGDRVFLTLNQGCTGVKIYPTLRYAPIMKAEVTRWLYAILAEKKICLKTKSA